MVKRRVIANLITDLFGLDFNLHQENKPEKFRFNIYNLTSSIPTLQLDQQHFSVYLLSLFYLQL